MGEETGEVSLAATSKAHSEDIRGWGGTRVVDVGNGGFPPKKEVGGIRG